MIKLNISKTFFLLPLAILLAVSNTISQTTIVEELIIEARIIEQDKGTLLPAKDVEIIVKDIGAFIPDDQGVILFPIQFDDNLEKKVTIELNTDEYQLIQPYLGMIDLDTSHLKIGLDVLILAKDSEAEFQQQIDNLQQQLHNLKAKNILSTTKLNALNDSMLQVILIHEQENNSLQKRIVSIETELASTKAGNAELEGAVEKLKHYLQVEQEKNRSLQNELVDALAENLKLQTEYLRVITGALNTYLLRVKDLQNSLKSTDQYYKGYKPNYDTALNDYGKEYLKIYDSHQGYIQNVQNAWQSKKVKTEVEKTFSIVINELHDTKVISIFDTVNGYIAQRKMKKVSKYSETAYEELSSVIRRLETNVKRLTKTMKKTMK